MSTQSSAAHPNEEKLGDVEVNVQRVLKPLGAPSEFRKRLHGGLVIAAQHQQEPSSIIEPTPSTGVARLWFMGAALVGVGLGFLLMRLRMR